MNWRKLINNLCLPCMMLAAFSPNAAIDVYQFSDEAQQQRFQQLTSDLRCPKCQNQNIADSNAEIARDLREKIYLMLGTGNSDAEIINYMVERYGDFVLYQPRMTAQTYLLWYGPVALLIIGGLVIVLISRRFASNDKENKGVLDSDQQQKLQRLLDEDKR